MGREGIDKEIGKILDEKETFLLSLIMLAHIREDVKYHDISELIFLFDNYNGFKKFIKYYSGQTIQVPTILDVRIALRLLELFQRVYIDENDFDESYEKLMFHDTGLSKELCRKELDKFNDYLDKEGAEILKQFKKLSKMK